MIKFSTLAVVCLIVIEFAGCKKGDEKYLEQHPTADLKQCPIERIIYQSLIRMDTLNLFYNSWGDPVSSTRTQRGTGHPNYEFRYDKKHRLADYIGLYEDGTGGEYWHKYFYDNPGNDNPTSDSLYTFITLQNGVITRYQDAAMTFYTYDKAGRIIKDSTLWHGGYSTVINHYSYDVNGNLEGHQYDQNLNPHRTNKIWMFLDRDYSVNNPFVADSYNAHKLPTKLNLDPKTSYFKLLTDYFHNAEIIYGCK